MGLAFGFAIGAALILIFARQKGEEK